MKAAAIPLKKVVKPETPKKIEPAPPVQVPQPIKPSTPEKKTMTKISSFIESFFKKEKVVQPLIEPAPLVAAPIESTPYVDPPKPVSRH